MMMLAMNVIGQTDTEQSEAQAKRRMCGVAKWMDPMMSFITISRAVSHSKDRKAEHADHRT